MSSTDDSKPIGKLDTVVETGKKKFASVAAMFSLKAFVVLVVLFLTYHFYQITIDLTLAGGGLDEEKLKAVSEVIAFCEKGVVFFGTLFSTWTGKWLFDKDK